MTEPNRTISATNAGFWDTHIGEDVDARPQTTTRRPPPQMVRPEPISTAITVAPRPIPEAPAWLGSEPINVAPALTSQGGARENTSAMDRAYALRVRLIPWLIAWSLISVVIGVAVIIVVQDWPGGALATLLVFAALTAITYYKMDSKDYEYSREGTERHRIDTAAELALADMEHRHELRKLALEAYLAHLRIGGDRG